LQAVRSQRVLGMRDVLFGSLAFLLVLVVAGIYHRRTLLSTRFHRYVATVIFVTSLENTCQRFIGLKLGFLPPQLMPLEMIVFAANIGLTSVFLIPWLRWVPLFPLLVAVLSLMGILPPQFYALTLPIIAVLFAIGWSRAAKSARSSKPAGVSGSHPLLAMRRTPTPSPNPMTRTTPHMTPKTPRTPRQSDGSFGQIE
jgi:hypothetical protein